MPDGNLTMPTGRTRVPLEHLAAVMIEKGQRVALAVVGAQPRGTLIEVDATDFVCTIVWDSGLVTHEDSDNIRWLTPLELLAEAAE